MKDDKLYLEAKKAASLLPVKIGVMAMIDGYAHAARSLSGLLELVPPSHPLHDQLKECDTSLSCLINVDLKPVVEWIKDHPTTTFKEL